MRFCKKLENYKQRKKEWRKPSEMLTIKIYCGKNKMKLNSEYVEMLIDNKKIMQEEREAEAEEEEERRKRSRKR